MEVLKNEKFMISPRKSGKSQVKLNVNTWPSVWQSAYQLRGDRKWCDKATLRGFLAAQSLRLVTIVRLAVAERRQGRVVLPLRPAKSCRRALSASFTRSVYWLSCAVYKSCSVTLPDGNSGLGNRAF
jgi:hypothetical protein